MLTRCPTCATTFRVQPEQLKVRHGNVRCGSCHQVFNALDTLLDEPVQALTPAPYPAAVDSSTPAKVAANTSTPVEALADAHTGQVASNPLPQHPSATTENTTPEFEGDAFDGAIADQTESEAPLAAEEQADTPAPVNQAERVKPRFKAMPLEPVVADLNTTEWTEGAQELEDSAASAAEPRSLWRQMLLAATIGLALSFLMLQAGFFWRVELALAFPETRALLESACQRIGCVLEWPRRPDLLSIESSDLNPDPVDAKRLRLAATLRNRASHVQAWPHLELSLTDTGDRVIVRRILAPSDYTPYLRGQHLRDGIPASSEIALDIHLDTGSTAASGYRLYVFYP